MSDTFDKNYPTLYDNDPVEEDTVTVNDDVTENEQEYVDDAEHVDRVEVNAVLESAVDATLAAVRKNLLENASEDKVRKAVSILQSERRKVRRRNVDTDVAVSELVFDAVLDMLNEGTEVVAASPRAAKNRSDRITLTEPAWWWSLVSLAADAHDATPADVISTAVTKHLG